MLLLMMLMLILLLLLILRGHRNFFANKRMLKTFSVSFLRN
jgi:hypothetical protein